MAIIIPTTEPEKFVAGDTLQFQISLADYPAPAWTLSYALVNAAGQIVFTSAASGADHLVTIPKATTAAWTPGFYTWIGTVDDGTSRFTVRRGSLEVITDFVTVGAFDARTTTKKVLDAVNAILEGRATKSQIDTVSYSIKDRSKSSDPVFLRDYRDKLMAEYKREQRAERIAKGLGAGNTIRVRF